MTTTRARMYAVAVTTFASVLVGPAHAAAGQREVGVPPFGAPGALSRAALELRIEDGVDAAALRSEPAAQARDALLRFSVDLPGVRRRVGEVPAGAAEIAQARITEAESQFALSRLHAYAGSWQACADAAAEAVAYLDAADAVASGWLAERRAFDLVIADLDETLARTRTMVVAAGFDPEASSALLHAEHGRSEVLAALAKGHLQAARWQADGVRDLAVIAMERAYVGEAEARGDGRPRWIAQRGASAPVALAPGAGGDVR